MSETTSSDPMYRGLKQSKIVFQDVEHLEKNKALIKIERLTKIELWKINEHLTKTELLTKIYLSRINEHATNIEHFTKIERIKKINMTFTTPNFCLPKIVLPRFCSTIYVLIFDC